MKRVIYLAVLFAVVLSGCAFRAGGGGGFRLTEAAALDSGTAQATDLPPATATPLPTDAPTLTPSPTLSPTPTPQMFPVITFAQNANCRRGPGTGFYAVISYTKGDQAELAGRNQDGSWVWVRMSNDRDYCWASASTIDSFGDVSVLSVIPYTPLPAAPTLLDVTRKICGSPNVLWIEWADVPGAQGYRLYRNGALLQSFPPTATRMIDFVKNAKVYQYTLEAFNDYGVAPRISVSEPGC